MRAVLCRCVQPCLWSAVSGGLGGAVVVRRVVCVVVGAALCRLRAWGDGAYLWWWLYVLAPMGSMVVVEVGGVVSHVAGTRNSPGRGVKPPVHPPGPDTHGVRRVPGQPPLVCPVYGVCGMQLLRRFLPGRRVRRPHPSESEALSPPPFAAPAPEALRVPVPVRPMPEPEPEPPPIPEATPAPVPQTQHGSEHRQRTRQLHVRVTPDEYAALEARASRAGLTMQGYIRAAALGHETVRAARRPAVEAVELARLLGALGKIGSNLNQLARAANQNRPGDPHALHEELAALGALRQAILAALGKRNAR